jgi:hypothetical protein
MRAWIALRCAGIGKPSTSISPERGCSCPVSILIVVDFPAPFGPRKPKISPGSTEKLTWSTARFSAPPEREP